jgi:hypothetical protein
MKIKGYNNLIDNYKFWAIQGSGLPLCHMMIMRIMPLWYTVQFCKYYTTHYTLTS